MNKPNKIITHHTGGTNANPRADTSHHTVHTINEHHKTLWPKFVSRAGWHVGYHYVIEADGTLTQTREHDEEGAHCIGQNRSSIGVCFAGNFDVTYPTKAQIDTWEWLYDQIGNGLPVYPHRKYATKSCHGLLLADDYFSRGYYVTVIERLNQIISQLRSLLTNKRR